MRTKNLSSQPTASQTLLCDNCKKPPGKDGLMRNGLPMVFAFGLCALYSPESTLAHDYDRESWSIEDFGEEGHDEDHYEGGFQARPLNCTVASQAQRSKVNEGNAKANLFLARCRETTGNSRWCEELMRPNPASREVFACTYGENQPHRLINPDENTWVNAFKAAQLVRDLEALGVRVAQIYNWWRPEPYNANVGGSRTRHPFGVSVDVRFASLDDMEKAHSLLCEFRRRGRLRALGYYGSTGLHFGIGDSNPNTWGKECS
jgi:hypothetical protein